MDNKLYKDMMDDCVMSASALVARIPDENTRINLIYDIIKRTDIIAKRYEGIRILDDLDEFISEKRKKYYPGNNKEVLDLLRELQIWSNQEIHESDEL